MDKLFEYFKKLLSEVNLNFTRYIYQQINWQNRMIGITGTRGVGKTTLILQYIKKELNPNKALYVTAEDFYFADHQLVELADQFVKMGGEYLFIDEVHKYKNWAKELKLIYDYHKELKVVFTGSAILDIKKGSADLSRRAVMYNLQGLSFREYLSLFHRISVGRFSLKEIVQHQIELPEELKHPLPFFRDYLKQGYYPFALDQDYDLRLRQVVAQTLENDIPMFVGMNVATGDKLKRLLSIISKSAPFKPNMSKIAEMLSVSRNNMADYFHYIEEAGLIQQLRNPAKGIRALGKVDKVYLENTNLSYHLAEHSPEKGNLRETFFLNQMKLNHKIRASSVSDFMIEGRTFEIGGRNKNQKQIQTIEHAFVVKDDIERGYLNTIPLWQFGLNY